MKCIHEYISEKLSDSSVYYWLGKINLNGKSSENRETNFNKYGKDRRGIIQFAKQSLGKLPPQSEEVIPRENWDLKSLVGETESQLLNPSYYTVVNYHIEHHKRTSDILSLFQCSMRKPYSHNPVYISYQKYSDFVDFASISHSGVVPWDVCELYPFRYDEWNHVKQSRHNDITNMLHKSDVVNSCRLIRYMHETGYKYALFTSPSPRGPISDSMIKTLIGNNIGGAGKWLIQIITPEFRDELISDFDPYGKMKGLVYSRIGRMRKALQRWIKCLKKCLDASSKKELEQFTKNESLSSPKYEVLDSISYDEVMEKFETHIKNNMNDDGEVVSGNDNMYYQSYYWTALDILLIGLGGNLVYDIDKTYHDMLESLQNDSAWICLNPDTGGFVFVHKELCKNREVKTDDCFREAVDNGICQETYVSVRCE